LARGIIFRCFVCLWRERAENRLADFHGTIRHSAHAQESTGKRSTTRLAENLLGRVTCADMAFRALISPWTLDGVDHQTGIGSWRWVAFKPMHGEAMVMGDLVLLETEINPVMLKLIEGGLEITAVHNHLLRASPATFYMHVGGHGDPAKMAAVIHDALSASKTPLATPAAATPPPAVDLDTAQLDQLIGGKGQANGGVYQFNVPRRDPILEGGMQIAPVGPMGVASRSNFQPTGGGKAAITGDFVLTNDEVTR